MSTGAARQDAGRFSRVRETLDEQAKRKGAKPLTSLDDLRSTESGSPTRSWTSSWTTSTVGVRRRGSSRREPHVVYDTNIASLAVKGRMPAALGTPLLGAVEVITFVTVGELIKWSDLRSWGARQRGALDAWLSQRPVIDSTDVVWT